ncbi:MAG: ceramidase domain-containing protein [Gammaproteobacteria bacterium]|nr:ceramidase domain-containing protein [Gammaproteobacteria bacterium]
MQSSASRARFSLSRQIFFGTAIVSCVIVFALPFIGQDQHYHQFADARTVWGIPNGLDVISNLPFLLAGGFGLMGCYRQHRMPARSLWLVTFTGISLVALGSAWYHLAPSDATLVWDRLPMTIGFMALLCAIVAEYVSISLGHGALIPALVIGIVSIVYWRVTGDLRLYVWVQFAPLLLAGAALAGFRSRFTHQHLLLLALVFYVVAKLLEACDAAVYVASEQTVSGHTLKHLSAAAACCCLAWMIRRRKPALDYQPLGRIQA